MPTTHKEMPGTGMHPGEVFRDLAHGEAGVLAEDGKGGVAVHRGTLVSRNEHDYLVLKAAGGAQMLYIPVRRVIQVCEPLS